MLASYFMNSPASRSLRRVSLECDRFKWKQAKIPRRVTFELFQRAARPELVEGSRSLIAHERAGRSRSGRLDRHADFSL